MFFKKRISEKKINAKTQFLIGLPAIDPSPSMVKAIKDILPQHTDVKEAYIFMKGTSDEKPILTLGIFFHNNITSTEVFSSIGLVIQSFLFEGENVDMIPLKDNIYQTVKNLNGSLIYSIKDNEPVVADSVKAKYDIVPYWLEPVE